jgi:inosine-uridine nucleoside N-ribohydrolase
MRNIVGWLKGALVGSAVAAGLAVSGQSRADDGRQQPGREWAGWGCGEDGVHPPIVIFDNDVDFDDTETLAYLAKLHLQGKIDLRLVSVTYSGAAFPGNGIHYERCMLQSFGLSHIPIVDSAQVGPNPFPDLLKGTIDAILSATLAGCTASTAPSAIPADQAIRQAIRDAERPVTIVAVGPLTNLASALQAPDGRWLAAKISRVFFDGGAIGVPAGLCCGLDSFFDDTQTFNVWADPGATQTTLERLFPFQMAMVGANATNDVPVVAPFVAQLAAQPGNPELDFVNALLANPILSFEVSLGGLVFWWDPLSGVASDTGNVVQYRPMRISIIQSGPATGRSIEVPENQPGGWVRFGVSADQALFQSDYLQTLSAPSSGP